jgi:N-acetylneuraminic acid mutarotase
MPQPLRRAFTAIEFGGKVVIAGGITQGGSHFELLDDVKVIDRAGGSWQDLPRLPYKNFAPSIEAIGSTIYLFGGMKLTKTDYEYVNHVYLLNPESTSWQHTGRYLKERKGFIQSVKISDKVIGLLGGHTYDNEKDGPVKTFEVFKLR